MKRWIFTSAIVIGLIAIGGNHTFAQKKKTPQPSPEIHDPANAVKNLDVHPELQATIFASEPKITNPTNLDIDHRGRIWLCDVVNYRGNNGKRKEGDRILILEDTDGDGVADKVKTFYQGRDIDSAMGICVLGNKVIVSASPNVFIFHFDDNDNATKKEVLFTKTGIPQHDHSAHSFVFGPDGRLYWNFGNTGNAVHDKNGKPVVDIHGNTVVANGKPYREGMVFRCDVPWFPPSQGGKEGGLNFDVLGWNFRNNYEMTIDSFGTIWQSDNDDDGNQGVRINYVMEYGNFGYKDEMTGAGWQVKRTNMEKTKPLQHWHLNDPGVVPNLLQTYAGSPTGICMYEGNLLPKAFLPSPSGRGAGGEGNAAVILHCDALPSVVRAYPVKTDGAGYKASIVNILDGNKKNNWFRPADVCVAPDGSLFVTDWYDPGVGGHQQRDSDRGRIFRVAPPGVKYNVPKQDFNSIEGNVEALKSPNMATRYIAWTNLHNAGAKAEAALLKLYASKVPHERARALWLLGRIENRGRTYVGKAISDADPNIRIVGIRLARQIKHDIVHFLVASHTDNDPAVRREAALAIRNIPADDQMALAWAWLASKHDGKDRWYLEALGIGAAGNWNRYLDSYMKTETTSAQPKMGKMEVIWRSRAARTPSLLADMVVDIDFPSSELPRIFRAFDFQKESDIKTEALARLAFNRYGDPDRAKFITSEAFSRLKNFDITKNPAHAAALNKILDQSKGTTSFVEMVGKFGVSARYPALLDIAQKQPGEQLGVDAIRVLLDRDQVNLIQTGLASKDKTLASNTAQAIASAGHDKANGLLLPIINDDKQDLELRRQATRALARNKAGAAELIKLAKNKKLPGELTIAAGSALSTATWKDIKSQAAKLFPAPTTKDKKPLMPISDLVKIKGNVANGQAIFAKAGTCAKCHQVNGEGKNVGPDLSEIGKKLSREAVFESILYPSASISHNFETYIVETKKGTTASGLLVSKTDAEISIKDAESIVRTFKMADVESVAKSAVSLMPADLHQAISTQELTDVVEYLLTLREARKK